MLRRSTLLLLTALVGAGCASRAAYHAAEQIQAVNSHAALEYISLALQDDPEDEKTLLLLRSLIQGIVHQHEAAVESLIQAGAWEEALAQCDRVIASAALVRSLPGGPYNLYYQENQRAKLTEPAANQAYQEGLRLEAAGEGRAAVAAYDRSLGLVANYRDAAARREALVAQVTAKIYPQPLVSTLDPEAARLLDTAVTTVALAKRPRFLKLTRDRDQADATLTLQIESAVFTDSGWQASRDSREVEVPLYDKKGKQTGTAQRMAYWTIFRRRTAYTLSAGFTVESSAPNQPTPSARFTANAESKTAYATWQGERSGVPSEVLDLPSSPAEPKNRARLTEEGANRLARDLGHQLFLAYK